MIDLDAISAGLNKGEFFLEYLPTMSLDSGRCVGAEALIRWRRPSGVVPPQEFIPLVENSHLSGMLTCWVIETAAAELGHWLRAHEDVHLGINVPPEILGRGGLEYVATRSGLMELAGKIVLEITERGVPDKLGLGALEAAARRGFRVALDDVSVGEANLVVLSRCKIDIIKVDRSVIGQITKDEQTPAWVSALTALLRATQLGVIAEGVETAEQVKVLRAAGVRLAQGFYFSRPISAQAFEAFFHARR
jgi:EAL domain-containing protein (putative c-di-GMP-specific phosphodiesterase class I)